MISIAPVPRPRRTPGQTLFLLILVLIGIWIGTAIVSGEFQAKTQAQEPLLRPDLHLVGVSATELVAAGYDASAKELPWTNISLRMHAAANGDFVRILSCSIPPSAVPKLLALEANARRGISALPPPWWPWDRRSVGEGTSGPFRVPDWFAPTNITHSWIMERHTPLGVPAWEGYWAGYDTNARRLWLWQWRRHDYTPITPPRTPIEPVDTLAQSLGAHLIAILHPVSDDGWLQRTSIDPIPSGIPPEVLAPGVGSVDVCLRPRPGRGGDHDYLIALSQVELSDLDHLLRDHPLRPLASDSPPPQLWAFALPDAGLPRWFQPGPGPRWGTAVVFPGTGVVHSGRWVAYETTTKRLLVWDWSRAQGVSASADIVAQAALPEWPAQPWAVPRTDPEQ